MPSPPGAAPRYRPRPATNPLKEIVEDSMEELLGVWDEKFRDRYGPLPARVRILLERFLRCGDLHFGFARLRCVNPHCARKGERLVPYSCRARGLCPSCGQRRALQWAERMVEEVLPLVPYRQLVFTIPVALRKAFLFDRSLYGDLGRVAYASTRDFMRSRASIIARQAKAVPAMIVSPQSFGDLLVPHSHAHAVISLGLFRKDGIYLPMEDLDFNGLEEVFRERFFRMLIRREKILPETVERFKSWDHSGFSVGWDRKLETEDREGLERLLTTIERPAVSLRRLRYRDDGMVHYQGSRIHPRLGIDHQLLSPVDFLALLIPHVLLKYEVTLRLYGALSTTWRRRLGWIENPPVHEPPPAAIPAAAVLELLDLNTPSRESSSPDASAPPGPAAAPVPASREDSSFIRDRRRSWARLIKKVYFDDPQLCRSCRQPMKIIAAIAPEQEDVIERILRSLKLWDPPWKRPRKARGPPPPARTGSSAWIPTQTEDIDPIIEDDLYAIDPIPLDGDDPQDGDSRP